MKELRNKIINCLHDNECWCDRESNLFYPGYPSYAGLFLPTKKAVAKLNDTKKAYHNFVTSSNLDRAELKIRACELTDIHDADDYYLKHPNRVAEIMISSVEQSAKFNNTCFDIHVNISRYISCIVVDSVRVSDVSEDNSDILATTDTYDRCEHMIRLTDDGAYYVLMKTASTVNQKAFSERKMIPLTVRYLTNLLPEELAEIIMAHYSNSSYLYKDIIKDEFYELPIKITDLCKYHSKKEYLEHTFKIDLPKSINKTDFKKAYRVCCAYKQTDKSVSISEMLQFKYTFNDITRFTARAKKIIGMDFINAFMTERYRKNHPVEAKSVAGEWYVRRNDPHIETLRDYIRFAEILNIPVDIKAGTHKVSRLHDEYTDKLVKRMNRGKKLVIPETVLKYIELPSEFTRLDTKSALIAEGALQHNCVGTYVDKINNGDCVCYTADIAGEHLTIEVIYRGIHGLYVNQCYTKCNKLCDPETREYVKNLIENQSDAALMRFVEKNGVTPAVKAAYNRMMSLPCEETPALTLEELCENFDFDAPEFRF